MMAYRVVPLARLHCNITDYPAISVSSHLYATIKLDIKLHEVQALNFTMHIDMANKTPSSFLEYSPSNLEVARFNKSRPYLEISSFEYVGPMNTVRYGLINNIAGMKHMVYITQVSP